MLNISRKLNIWKVHFKKLTPPRSTFILSFYLVAPKLVAPKTVQLIKESIWRVFYLATIFLIWATKLSWPLSTACINHFQWSINFVCTHCNCFQPDTQHKIPTSKNCLSNYKASINEHVDNYLVLDDCRQNVWQIIWVDLDLKFIFRRGDFRPTWNINTQIISVKRNPPPLK